MSDDAPVILIDDEAAMRQSLGQWLGLSGFAVASFADAESALGSIGRDFPGAVVTDLRLPGMDGMALLAAAQAIDGDLPVVMITGHGDVAQAVEAMRRGAYDFIEKPFPPERLSATLSRAVEKRALVLENRQLRRAADADHAITRRLIGNTPAVAALRRDILDLARADVPVLIHGETGTGKEVVARALHDFGPRRERHFVAVNAGAIPETMGESELFGHEPGAFTGAVQRRIGRVEHAHRGTLFLDEIESMPLSLQVKLLRVLQEGSLERLGSNKTLPVDCRAIAATKVDLRQAADRGAFREDLYYRLGVAELQLPPLRERREDIPLLFAFFAAEAARRYGREVPAIDYKPLMARDWPGNVRELRNEAERLTLGLSGRAAQPAPAGPMLDGRPLAELVAAFEATVIDQALRDSGGDVAQAMERLGLPRRTLNEKMARYGIERGRYLRK